MNESYLLNEISSAAMFIQMQLLLSKHFIWKYTHTKMLFSYLIFILLPIPAQSVERHNYVWKNVVHARKLIECRLKKLEPINTS